MKVNVLKTKILIFRKGGIIPRQLEFIYEGSPIEIVKRFKYLDIVFSTGGSFSHCITRENLLYTTILISFVVQYVCFLVLYQACPCIGSSGSRCGMFKTDCDFKMSEISNIACRWVKTMPELLKPRPPHVHGNFVFSVCKL